MLLLIVSILTFINAFIILGESIFGLRLINNLADVSLERHADADAKVSVIVTAKNEAASIEKTIRMLQHQQHSNFEMIIVNDRSSDETGAIAKQLADGDARIKVLNIVQLPADWIGKNYASYQGAQLASGDWLLFIDADVCLEETTLTRTLAYCAQKKLDHLTVLFKNHCHGFFFNIFHLVHKGPGYVNWFKPWRVNVKTSKRSINSGAFCLIKKSVYEALGGHKTIASKCIDDIELGKLIKQHHFNQDIVNAQDFVSITWYDSLSAMCNGFNKNCFAYFRFNVFIMLAAASVWMLFYIWPFIACFFTSGWTLLFNLLTAFCFIAGAYRVAGYFKIPRFYALFFPVGAIIYLYPMFASMIHFFYHRGIYWRGTYYSAAQLRNMG